MSTNKQTGKRAQMRAMKESLRRDIFDLRDKIKAAIMATRVPDRVMAGDAVVAATWKEKMEKGTAAAYHIDNEPSGRLTIERLTGIRMKLQGVLASLT